MWLKSYLSARKQRVLVDGTLSDPLDIDTGVPQGSILGPLLYICFTNDMPNCIHDHVNNSFETYESKCDTCGYVVCYADDSTFSKSHRSSSILKEEIKIKYKDIVDYMSSNRLVINTDKTHLMVMSSRIDHHRNGNHDISLDTGSETIYPTQHEKLLGGYISNFFTWNFHVRGIGTLVLRVNSQ